MTIPHATKPGWLARLSLRGTGSVNLGSTDRPRMSRSFCLARCELGKVSAYITSARFSSSCCRTGMAHPAISTRPAASSAALGETP